MDLAAIEQEALSLSPEDRAKLAQRLLLSLEALSEEQVRESWLIEAEQRAREIDRGEVKPIPAEEVRRKARTLLR